ncbi:hypothetical protein [Promicromonospora soli]
MPASIRDRGSDLEQRVRGARRRLGETIIAAARLTPGHDMVWGQFADAPARASQTGIYGTSAAVTMLAARGRDLTATVSLLPGITDSPAAVFDASDLFITHKASAVVEALVAVDHPDVRSTTACLRLSSGIVDGQGWGHHVVPGEPEAPSVLATARALTALSAIDRMDPEILEGPAAWLRSRILDDGPLGTVELAFAVIALARLQRAGIGASRADALQRGAHALHDWLRQVHAGPILYEQIHYWVPKPGEQRNHYMTFPVQVVVGIALVLSGSAGRSQSLLRDLANSLCHAVEADGGLRSTLTERIGMVDASLVDQFFLEYLAAQPASTHRRRALGRLARARWLHRALVFLVLVVVAFWSWYVAAGDSRPLSAASIANIAFALVTGILGSMAYSRWDRR